MHPALRKTFGGLRKDYYFRHLFFGALMASVPIYLTLTGAPMRGAYTITFAIVNALLYPYSRFVYESIVNFILGENTFFLNALIMLFFKLFTMMVCFMMATMIAPIGLLYLYFHHSRQAE